MKLEKGVPFPEKPKRKTKYEDILNDAQIGDSIYVLNIKEIIKYRAAIVTHANKFKLNWMVRSKKSGDGWRLWILKDDSHEG